MPGDAKKHSAAIVVGALVLLVVLLVWFGGSGGDGAQAFTVGRAVHEVTSLPDQTLHLYNKVAPRGMQLGGARVPSAIATGAKAKPAAAGASAPGRAAPRANFVGAFGRTPEMQHCLNYDSAADKTYDFNRCTWV